MRLALALLALTAAPGAEDAVRHALRRGDLAAAITLAERDVAESPSSSEAHHWLGKAYGTKARSAAFVAQMSLAKKCRAELARAVELDAGNLAAALDLVRYDARAPSFLGGGREKARALAEEIGKRRPSRGEVAKGILYEAEKNTAAAEGAFRGALMQDPSDGEALSALTDFLASRKRWADAFAACQAAAESAPEDPRPYFEIGLLAVESGREVERGLEALDRFLALPQAADGPDHADGHLRRGQLLARLGDVEAARAELMQALALEPGHAGANQALAELARKRDARKAR
jgi:tetratricopeptide (TPR) repeat protein